MTSATTKNLTTQKWSSTMRELIRVTHKSRLALLLMLPFIAVFVLCRELPIDVQNQLNLESTALCLAGSGCCPGGDQLPIDYCWVCCLLKREDVYDGCLRAWGEESENGGLEPPLPGEEYYNSYEICMSNADVGFIACTGSCGNCSGGPI